MVVEAGRSAGGERTVAVGSHSFWGTATPVGSHRIVEAAARAGWRAIHVDRPRRALPGRVVPQRTGIDGACHLAVRSLLSPHRLRSPLGLQALPVSVRLASRRLRLASTDMVLIDHPDQAWLTSLARSAIRVYRPTDIYALMRGDERYTEAERWILQRVHGAVATSKPVLEHLRSLAPDLPLTLLRNGVDFQHFAMRAAARPPEYHGDRSVYLYCGRIDERFDWSTVRTICDRRPDVDVVVVGPIDVPPPVPAPENLRVLGPRPYAELPGYMQHARVGLLPLSDHPGNRSRSPMKFYEYLAAGLPVIARSTPELSTRTAPGVFLYAEPEDVVPAIDAASGIDDATREGMRDAARSADWSGYWSSVVAFVSTLRPDPAA